MPIDRTSFGAYAYGWEPAANTGGGSYERMIDGIRKATALREASFQGCYAGSVFDIPRGKQTSIAR